MHSAEEDLSLQWKNTQPKSIFVTESNVNISGETGEDVAGMKSKRLKVAK